MKIEIVTAITSLFPFMILQNFSSLASFVYHLSSAFGHENENIYKSIYILNHIDMLLLGYVWDQQIKYLQIVFHVLSILIIYKCKLLESETDRRYIDLNIAISVIKSTIDMIYISKINYIICLYFWGVAFIIHYEKIYGKYSDIVVNFILCPSQYILKNIIYIL